MDRCGVLHLTSIRTNPLYSVVVYKCTVIKYEKFLSVRRIFLFLSSTGEGGPNPSTPQTTPTPLPTTPGGEPLLNYFKVVRVKN